MSVSPKLGLVAHQYPSEEEPTWHEPV
jgi:hypothetical protein